MTEIQIPPITPEAAVLVLQASMDANMLARDGMPESDADKIAEAAKMIPLAMQGKKLADQVGPQNLANWDQVKRILQAVGLEVEAGTPVAPPAATPPPPPPTPAPPADMQQMADATGMAVEGSSFLDPPGTNFRAEPGGEAPVQVGSSDPVPSPPQTVEEAVEAARAAAFAQAQAEGKGPIAAAPAMAMAEAQARADWDAGEARAAAPAPASTVDPETIPAPGQPQTGELWLDAEGGQWHILHGGGGPQVQAKSMTTGESTTLPTGYLRQCLGQAVEHPAWQPEQPQAPEPPAIVPPAPAPSAPPLPPQDPTPSASPTPPLQPSPAPSSQPPSSPPPAPSPTPETEPTAATSTPSGAVSPEPSSPPSLPSPPSSASSSSEPPPSVIPVDDDEGDETYGKLLETVDATYTPFRMPVPYDLESVPEPLPEDLTKVDDGTARRLHSQFAVLAARSRYLAGIDDAKARACGRILDHHLGPAMRASRGKIGKDASVGEVRQHALAENSDCADWARRQGHHADRAEAYRTFQRMYSEDVSVLSRDWTMRDNEEKAA